MSNDRHDDKQVSAAYKALANERTPVHLDQKILAMAARATKKPAYSRWMRWSRPVAWAATITLCLAITLELMQDPAMDMSIDPNSPAPVTVPEERKRDDGARDTDVVAEQNSAKDKRSAKDEMSLAIQPADLERQQEATEAMAESLAETAASEKTSLARSASKQSHVAQAPVVAEPETEADLQNAPVTMRKSAVSIDEDDAATDNNACSTEARATAGDWLQCITDLESMGLDEAAAAERELLIDTFPDFKLP